MMSNRLAAAVRIALLIGCCAHAAGAQEVDDAATPSETELLSPPELDGPLVVHASFKLVGISQIEEEAEEVAFTGVLTLVWMDARQSFDPATEGVSEKVLSRAFQFNELAPSWYPQVTLANASGQYDSKAVILRVQPDGTHTLIEKIEGVAKVDLDLRKLPFDRQQLELVFRLFGYEASEVVFEATPDSATAREAAFRLPQWTLEGVTASIQTMQTANSSKATASVYAVTLEVKRQPLFMMRLVVFPLTVIVALSWSVFWMDRSSVGDRLNVSFVGILAAVAYQITLVGIVPNVSYFTLMHEYLNLSFLLMCSTVVISLYVNAADRHGFEHGDRIDRWCRWLYPLVYFGLIGILVAAAFLMY